MILFAWRLYRVRKAIQLVQAIRRRDLDHLLSGSWRSRLILRPIYRRFVAPRMGR